jgi:exosortase A-associated hydrolase 1
MTHNEDALVFECEGRSLVGILSGAGLPAERGVLIVVGGPQYRAGSHRQFTLLARHLAEHGVPALRFDYRGIGDSDGEVRTFEGVGADIRCAIDRFFASVPGLKGVVIWGLCDAASAALFYAHQDARVRGLVLLNPWVRTQQGLARAHLQHYYLKRLFQASLWRKIARGEFRVGEAAGALRGSVVNAMGRRRSPDAIDELSESETPLPERMERGLRKFRGRVLFILSGNDLTAQEFKDVVARSRDWQQLLAGGRVTRYDLAEANHTFARRDWRDQVERWTEAWVKSF